MRPIYNGPWSSQILEVHFSLADDQIMIELFFILSWIQKVTRLLVKLTHSIQFSRNSHFLFLSDEKKRKKSQ